MSKFQAHYTRTKIGKINILLLIALLLIIPLWIFIVAPSLTKIPNDFSYKADVTSVDNFYNAQTKQFGGEQFSKTKFSYEVISRDGNKLVIKNVFDVQTLEGKSVFKAEPLYGIDANTGQHLTGLGDKNREGYLFSPKGLERGQEFTYWHASSNTPAPMKYVSEEKLYGLTVYKYESNYGGEIDQTDNLKFLPDVGKTKGIKLLSKNTVWVEPVSGYMVKQEDSSIDYYYYDLSTGKRIAPYNKFLNKFTENSVQENVSVAQQKKFSIYLYHNVVPILITLTVLLLIVIIELGYVGGLYRFISKYVVLIVVVVGLLTLTFFSYGYVKRSVQKSQTDKYLDETSHIQEEITNRLSTYINALQGGKALFAASDSVDRDEWASYIKTLDTQKNYPGVQGFGFAESVKQQGKNAFINSVRAEGFPNFQITPSGDRTEYVPIKYLEPFNTLNQRAFGFDMYSETTRQQGIDRARDSGSPSMTGKVTLVQESSKNVQAGFLIYVPIYKGSSEPGTVEDRKNLIKGYVYSPFRANDFIDAIEDIKDSPVDFKIYDGLITNDEHVLHDFTAPSSNISFRKFETIYTAGQPWTIEFINSSTNSTTSRTDRYAPTVVIIGGVLTTLLAFALVYSVTRSRQKAVNYAERLNKDLESRTSELQKNNQKLESKYAELDKINSVLVGREIKMIELKDKLKELESGKKK